MQPELHNKIIIVTNINPSEKLLQYDSFNFFLGVPEEKRALFIAGSHAYGHQWERYIYITPRASLNM